MLPAISNPHPMQQQQPQSIQLPYEPIKFVYTQTIGSLEEKFREIVDPYTWTYQDLLEPKIIYTKSKIQYYLFHIAPIYNWLRYVGSNMIAQYVQSIDDKLKSHTTNNKPINHNQSFSSTKNSQQQQFSQQAFMFQMNHYISQWEIVKLCATAKIKIITTRTVAKKVNPKLVKSQSNTEEQLVCTHLIKKDKFTTDYVLNTLDSQQNPKLQCSNVHCPQCQKNITVKAQLVKYPFAPYFNKYHGKQFTIVTNPTQQTTVTYLLVIIYSSQKVYVKSSAGVWYEISLKENKKSIVSFQRIDSKSGLVFVYHQQVKIKGDKVLRKAEPVKVEEFKKQEKTMIDLSKFISKKSRNSDDEDDQNYQQHLNSKAITKTPSVLNKSQTIQPKQEQNIASPIQPEQIQQENNQPLQDMSKNPLPIIMNKKKTERKLFKEYKKTVEALLPKQKEKDQYEKEYDKGKTKKIHKNRQQFRTADFFSLYNKLKGGNEDHKNKNQGLRDDDGERRRNNQNDNDDENYNEVYRDKRNDRFGERRGEGFRGRGRSRGRGGMHGGRDNNYRGSQGGRGSRGGRGGRGGFKSYNNNRNNGFNNSNYKSKGKFHNSNNNNRNYKKP